MKVNFNKVFRFPFEDSTWPVKILIGIALSIIPVINLFVFGYLLVIVREACNRQEPRLPDWHNWSELFTQGFFVFIICLLYSIIPLIFFVLSTILLGTLAPLGVLFLLVTFLISLAAAFFIPIAIASYSMNKNFSDAFDFKGLFNKLKERFNDYIPVFLIGIGIEILLFLIGCIPILGWLVVIFASFYVEIVLSRMLGESYATA